VRFPLSWPERIYGLVLVLYPRSFRQAYEHEMRRVFRDLLHDPDTGAWRLTRMVAGDIAAGVLRVEHLPNRDIAERSALFGLLVVLFALLVRSLHPGAYLGFTLAPVPFIAFIPAGFWGARHTRTFSGGMWTGLIMGAVSSTTIYFDAALFHNFPFYDPFSFVLSMLIASGLCIVPTAIGAIAGAAVSPAAPLTPPPSTGGVR
jgi:hypothetical protein